MEPSELKKFFAEIDEDDAWDIFCYAKRKYGWVGVVANREDAELDWSDAVRHLSDDDDDTSTPVDPVMSDELWEELRHSNAWLNINDELRAICERELNFAVWGFYDKKAKGK